MKELEALNTKLDQYARSVGLLAESNKVIGSALAEIAAATKFRAGGASDVVLAQGFVPPSGLSYEGLPANKVLIFCDTSDYFGAAQIRNIRVGRENRAELLKDVDWDISGSDIVPIFDGINGQILLERSYKNALEFSGIWFTKLDMDYLYSVQGSAIRYAVLSSSGNNTQNA